MNVVLRGLHPVMIFRELSGHHRALLLPVVNLALIKLRASSPDVMNQDLAVPPLMMPTLFIFLGVDLTYCAFPFEINDPLLHR
jgi:hypothetical protein